MRKAQRALALAGMAFVATATIGMSATSAFAAPGDHHPGGGNGGNNGNQDWNHNGGGNGGGNGGNQDWNHNGGGNGGNQDWNHNGGGNGGGNGNQDWNHNGHNGDRRWDQRGNDTARLAGVFKSRNACEATGWLGEHWGKWDSYDCERHGRVYFLEVEKHKGDWHRHGHHH